MRHQSHSACPACMGEITDKPTYCTHCESPHHPACWSATGKCANAACTGASSPTSRRSSLISWQAFASSVACLILGVAIGSQRVPPPAAKILPPSPAAGVVERKAHSPLPPASPAPSNTTKVVQLYYARAGDVAEVLRSGLGREVLISINSDPRTNQITICSDSATLSSVSELLKELDQPVPQVLLETRIIVASRDGAETIRASLAKSPAPLTATQESDRLEQTGLVATLAAPRLLAIQGTEAALTVSDKIVFSGGPARDSAEESGLAVRMTPRIKEDRTVEIELTVKRPNSSSKPASETRSVADGREFLAVDLPAEGVYHGLSRDLRRGKRRGSRLLIICTPRILRRPIKHLEDL